MSRARITDAVKGRRILVSDGAWGTFLQEMGLKSGECPEMWNLEHPEQVRDIARRYSHVGSDMVETNSFGGNSIKLQLYGLSERTEEINESAARLSRAGAGDERWVVASVGPTGKMLVMGETSENELLDAFKQQSVALARGGADAICIETMSAIDEAALAVQAARDCTECEVICTFTFDRTVRGDYRTMMGVSPADAAKSSVEAGAHIVGANCGNGFAGMIDIVEEIRAASVEVPVLVHANAGIPQNVGGKIVYPETPGQMADLVPDLIKAGANVIGGCCGTTPDHIRAIREAVDRLS